MKLVKTLLATTVLLSAMSTFAATEDEALAAAPADNATVATETTAQDNNAEATAVQPSAAIPAPESAAEDDSADPAIQSEQ
ncbi:hypothetical protein [Acinetobacter larvae]|uniref:Uncharacterized protein n=1 Tax=Acinetobacter larvae TaxID=1789224 RepID=A0A1B2LWV3_9GAMM|nr:hypothetical protein [Acinetobacter larvae]AOA57414.1 hypothetical protein BFG52_02965 [Acinetobacter larvae]